MSDDDQPISHGIRDMEEAQWKRRRKLGKKTLLPIYLNEDTVNVLRPLIWLITIILMLCFVLALIAAAQFWHCKVEDHNVTIGQCFWVEEKIAHDRRKK